MFPLSILVHHAEPGDPVLLEWLNHQLSAVLGLGALALVIITGLVILAVPAVIIGAYLVQRGRQNGR